MSASKARKIVELYREIEKRDAEIALLRANLELQQKSYEREIVLEVAAERERWRHALEYAIKEADGWHDECHGGPIESKDMDAARALLGPNVC